MSFLSDYNGTSHILDLSHIVFCILSWLFQHSSLVQIWDLWLLVAEELSVEGTYFCLWVIMVQCASWKGVTMFLTFLLGHSNILFWYRYRTYGSWWHRRYSYEGTRFFLRVVIVRSASKGVTFLLTLFLGHFNVLFWYRYGTYGSWWHWGYSDEGTRFFLRVVIIQSASWI